MSISMLQAITLWDELVRAYHGVNHYGGDTAEIYIYTMMPHSPTFAANKESGMGQEAARLGCQALHGMLELFKTKYPDAKIDLMGHGSNPFPYSMLLDDEPFTHRVHIRITSEDDDGKST